MTDPLVPLVVLWMLSSRREGGGGSSAQPKPPRWPTTRSPPPPMPAFAPHVPEPPQHGTPLTTLHNRAAAPKPKAKPSIRPPADILSTAKHTAASTAKAAALKAAKGAFTSRGFNPFASLMPTPNPMVSKSVLELQALVNVRGGTLKKDGLYGPKTASAWSALARQNGLVPDISRVSAKVARVAEHTFDVLNVPPIP